jgi:hypothetical protein
MARAEHDDLIAVNSKYRSMRRLAAKAKDKLPNFERPPPVFRRLRVLLEILCQTVDSSTKPLEPSPGLFFGAMLRPPIELLAKIAFSRG